MNKLFVGFIVFVFGIMVGYTWQNYHNKLLVGDMKQIISENQQSINEMRDRIFSLQDDIRIEQVVQRIIICESQGKYNVVGDGSKSYGPAQFQQKTFNWMKAQAGQPELHWMNSEHQIWLLRWALKNGYGNHWSCYRSI
ncbi:hypothetical protein HY948_03515 [Candidatus Gottesmanbacteria bacterium]|nr:hypothetical protein [Candidatus Gottesmanbacteria bacterium]